MRDDDSFHLTIELSEFSFPIFFYFYCTEQMIASHDAKQTESTDSRTNSLRRNNRLVVADSSDMEQSNSSKCCGT